VSSGPGRSGRSYPEGVGPLRSRPNAVRRLEREGVAHRLHAVSAGVTSGPEMAAALGVEARLVLRTLVCDLELPGRVEGAPRRRGRRLALVGSDRTLDLARLARAAGALEARLAAPRDAERWTGLSLGGISPLAVRPASFEVLADERLRDEPRVFISAGVRGLELELAPADLARSVDAQWVRLV
jgi:Cys-tRNA(Pro)/Cys-tRNA(Cys) deacylase